MPGKKVSLSSHYKQTLMNRFGKKARLWLLASLPLLLLFSCGQGSKEPVTLKLNFKPGEKYLYTTQVSQNINATINGMNSGMDQSMLMEMTYAYEGEEAGNKKLKITYDHVAMNLNTAMGPVQYDSKNPGSTASTDMAFMNNLIGKSFIVKVAPNGDIAAVDGLAELVNSLSANEDANVRSSLETQFSDTTIRMMMQNSFDLYPGKPVKVGESWSKKSVMSMGGFNINVNVENTYTLKSVDDGKATIALTSVMNLPATDMSGATGVPTQIQMNGKQEGTMEINIASGQILSGKTTQQINGNISGGQSVPISITGDMTISSKKL